MRIPARIFSTLVVACLFFACNRNSVSLDFTNAKDEVPVLGNLSFRFNKSLVPDSLLNRWDSSEYVSFEPKIPGQFRWEHPDELIFSPSRPLSPATAYSAVLKNEILQFSNLGRIDKGDGISFHTAGLNMVNSSISWVLLDEQSTVALPQLNLEFNYPVNPASLKDKLKVDIDRQPAAITFQTLSASNRIALRLQNVKMEDKNYQVQVSIGSGLIPEGGETGTKDNLQSKLIIPSPFRLLINDVSTEHDGVSGIIRVSTSQQVVATGISSFVKFNPSVKFTVEPADDGFVIRSDNFDAAKSYALEIGKGLRGRIGGVLQDVYSGNVAFGQLEPSIGFTNPKSVYLSAKGEKNIEIKIINVPKVKVIISKVYESNLLAAQRYGYYPNEKSNGENNSSEEGEYSDGARSDAVFGDVIYEQEIETRSLPKAGNNRIFNFNFADKLPELKGIYHIMIRSTKDYWVRDNRFVSLSDIGLIAKQGMNNLLVFANSIKTAQSAQGVNLVVYGANNQVLGMGTTNADGVADIAFTRKEFSGFKPALVVAKTPDDFNYLPFSASAVNTSRFETGGKRANNSGLDAFIYPERDIYRPGERVNFSVIVRDRQWKVPGELPLKLKFLMPNGKELKTFRKNLNEQGSLEGNVDIAQTSITGSYSLEVYTSNDVLLATQAFRIEEFVPDRIKVTAKLDKPFLQPGDAGNLSIRAVNFFGPPAANRNYECEIQVKQKSFSPKKYASYDFSIDNKNTPFEKVVREGKTNEQGGAEEKYEVPVMFSNIGILQSTFYATVFDETGRPVSRSTSVDIITQPHFFGVANDGYGYYGLNQEIEFPLLCLDKDEKLLSGVAAKVDVVKHEYRTVLSKSGSYFRYESQQEDKLVASNTVTVSGENTKYKFIPRTPGEYELRIALPGANAYVSRNFYSYGFWGGDNTSFAVNNEGQVDMELDKESYSAGETAKVLFKAPFDGRMLVTMETDKVTSYQYVKVEKRNAHLELKLDEGHVPNVYITATLFKPHEVSDIPLTVAHGFHSVKVEDRERKINVEIVAEKSARSKTHQKITVKGSPNAMITLAAVDNGVLQVSDFITPDPYGHYYAKRALEVGGYDIYPLLFPEIRSKLSSTGGDGESDMKKRVNPMPAKRIKILSYWSGIKKANSSGEAEFEFDIPVFSGEVRLMAVAYKNESFGSKESSIKIADPIVLSAALPRFMSPKDTVLVPVTVTNTTARSTSANVSITASGKVEVVGSAHETIELAPNNEGRVIFRISAPPATGTGKVLIDVNSMGEKFTDETELSVRPAASLQKLTGSGTIAGGSNQKLSFGENDFITTSVDYRLVVSRSPAVELSRYLLQLVQYPYGCTEQTVSAAFPQLYFGDLADLLHTGKTSVAGANANIQEAIRKIKMRQLYNGAISLWDEEDTENWWATIYAAHFLLEAQKAGFDVDKSLIETILGYVNSRLQRRETVNYYYNRNQSRRIVPKETIYGAYVLALAGRPNISVMNYYKANPALLSLDCRYLLSAAFALSGDKKSFLQFLPTQFAGEESVAQSGGSFYSDIRDESLALDVLIDVDPQNAQIPLMAHHVSEKLKARDWYSTQELAFSFLALGKLARQSARSDATAEVKVNGKTAGTMNGADLRLNTEQLKGNTVELVSKGSGRLYYFWQAEGISTSGKYKEEDSYLKVRKKFFDRYGRAIPGNTFKQNDLIIVQITLEKTFSTDVDNIVITDMLAAGFEIENPRTKEIPGMDWIKEAGRPTAIDVRDDRINMFVNLGSNRQTYYYAVRAVSPGQFQMGPVSADAMYNGEYHSYNGGGVIKVIQ